MNHVFFYFIRTAMCMFFLPGEEMVQWEVGKPGEAVWCPWQYWCNGNISCEILIREHLIWSKIQMSYSSVCKSSQCTIIPPCIIFHRTVNKPNLLFLRGCLRFYWCSSVFPAAPFTHLWHHVSGYVMLQSVTDLLGPWLPAASHEPWT